MGRWSKPHPARKWVEATCKYCGAAFETPQWKINQGKGKYCCKTCYQLGSRVADGSLDVEASLALAREAAKKWHASDEGREWHRQHAYDSILKGRPDPKSVQSDD